MSEQKETFNPEFNPLGAEGSIDTNAMPWIPIKDVSGLYVKPIRVSPESGMFSIIFKLDEANTLGINKKIENGFIIAPVKYNNKLN